MKNTTKCPHCHGTGEVPDDRKIGELMRSRREKKDISLREVARRMDFSAPYISDLEHGRRHWTDGVIESYNRALKQ